MSELPNQGSSRDRLLAAALSLIAQQGYAQTATAQVARKAGTSESQLIKHFSSKEGLLEALFDATWNDLNRRVGQLTSSDDPVERLRAIVALMLSRFAADDEVRRLLLFEGRRIRSRGAAVSDGFIRFVEGIDALVADAKRAGRLRVPVAPRAIRSVLIGACEGMLRDRQLAEEASYPAAYSRKDIQRAMEVLISAFFIDSPSPRSRRRGTQPEHLGARRRHDREGAAQKIT